ncbi:hypothetical protein HHK36_029608 [Tetracentron sinense]|uniref:Uncharacterized protein n=1 Tax=Tetracentron sinense TaxID=13715 RepID=A0A834YBZ5_TETSI|nr:hypothetical protein HHK36_029608 [Tetracentron sinense]
MQLQVQILIERCLLLAMSRDDCIEALAEYASIRPVVTLTGMQNMLCSFSLSMLSMFTNSDVERATKREQGLLSSIFPCHCSKAFLQKTNSKGVEVYKKEAMEENEKNLDSFIWKMEHQKLTLASDE